LDELLHEIDHAGETVIGLQLCKAGELEIVQAAQVQNCITRATKALQDAREIVKKARESKARIDYFVETGH
jgi:hypothetical protein